MNAYSSEFHKAGAGVPAAMPAPASTARSAAGTISRQWAALQDAAAAVAALAEQASEPPSRQIRNYPALIKDVGGWRLELAAKGVSDLAAIMQPGLTALLAVNARGQDARPAAQALWLEFQHARESLLALAPDTGSLGPRRSA